jgi:hypothetical protein
VVIRELWSSFNEKTFSKYFLLQHRHILSSSFSSATPHK